MMAVSKCIYRSMLLVRGTEESSLGKGGQTMRRIGTAARKDLELALNQRVHLFSHVKYRKDWMDDSARYNPWDLDYNA